MTPRTKQVLVAYGAFCAINAAIGYFYARNYAPGQNKLADLNTKLLPFNLLARLLPQATGAAVPALASNPQTTFPSIAAPTITDQASGTTTYFNA